MFFLPSYILKPLSGLLLLFASMLFLACCNSSGTIVSWEQRHFDRALKLYLSNRNSTDLQSINRAIALNRKEAAYFRMRANFNYELKNYQQALKDYSRSIQLNPKNASTYGFRAWCYRKLGNSLAAIEDLKTCSVMLDIPFERISGGLEVDAK